MASWALVLKRDVDFTTCIAFLYSPFPIAGGVSHLFFLIVAVELSLHCRMTTVAPRFKCLVDVALTLHIFLQAFPFPVLKSFNYYSFFYFSVNAWMPESFTRKNQLPEAKQFIIQHLSHNCLRALPFFYVDLYTSVLLFGLLPSKVNTVKMNSYRDRVQWSHGFYWRRKLHVLVKMMDTSKLLCGEMN